MHIKSVLYVASLLILGRAAMAAEFYVLSQPERAIYRIDSAGLGHPVLVVRLPGEGALAELVDLGDGRLVTFDATSNEAIVLDTAEWQLVARVTIDQPLDEHMRGYAVSSQGVLYGVFPAMKLAAIDIDTGVTKSLVTLHGAARVEALAIGPGDRLFASGSKGGDNRSENLYRVDLSTGRLTLVGAHGFDDLDTLTFGGDTYFYGADARSETTNELLRLNPRSGKAIVVGDTGVRGVNGISLIRSRTP